MYFNIFSIIMQMKTVAVCETVQNASFMRIYVYAESDQKEASEQTGLEFP